MKTTNNYTFWKLFEIKKDRCLKQSSHFNIVVYIKMKTNGSSAISVLYSLILPFPLPAFLPKSRIYFYIDKLLKASELQIVLIGESDIS